MSTGSGVGIKEGLLSKRGGGFPFLWQERNFKLYPSKLEYYSGNELKGSVRITHHSTVQMVTNLKDKPFAFSLTGKGGVLLMCGHSMTNSSEWVDAIKASISNSQEPDNVDECSDEEGELDESAAKEEDAEVISGRSTGNTVMRKSVFRHFKKPALTGVHESADEEEVDKAVSDDAGNDDEELQNRRKFGGGVTTDISVVEYGDILTLEADGSFLAVDVCGNVVWLVPESGFRVPAMFDRCLWQVSVKLSYTDQEFLAEAKKQSTFSSDEVQSLKVQAAHEVTRNKAEVLKIGSHQGLLYGDVIQLRHTVTGQYLAAKSTAARINRDCLGLYLTTGASAAFFKTLPRYKVRKEGGSVLKNDVILLSSLSNPGFYVHNSGSRPPSEEGTAAVSYKTTLKNLAAKSGIKSAINDVAEWREANLSRMLYDCGIAANIYTRPDVEKDSEYLHVGQCMRLFDRENDGFLFADCGVEAGKMAQPTMKKLTNEGNANHPMEFVSGAVWSIEYVDGRNVGGLVEWTKPLYRIKHAPTNTFLTVKEDDMHAADNSSDGNFASLSLERDSLDPQIIAQQTFYFNISESKREFVPCADVFVLVTHRSVNNQEYFLHYAKTKNSFVMSDLFNVYNALMLVTVSLQQQDTVRLIADVVPLLKTYVSAFSDFSGAALPRRSFELEEELAVLSDIVKRCMTNAPPDLTVDELMELLGTPAVPFQDCAREQMLVDVLLEMVVAPINYGLSMDFQFNQEKKKKDWVDPSFKVISTVHRMAWTCLKNLVRKNHASCHYAADKQLMYKGLRKSNVLAGSAVKRTATKTGIVPICVEQIPYPVYAARFLNHMITDSKTLLAQVATTDNIHYFRDMVVKYGARASFMNFFIAICSCQDEAIPHNQNLLVKELVLNRDVYRQVFIHTYVNPADDEPYKKWTVTVEDGEMEDYYGKTEFERLGGFPYVYVAWSGSEPWVPGNGLYSTPEALGMSSVKDKNGKRHTTLEELCWVLEPETMCPKVKGITFEEYTDLQLDTEEKKELFDDHVKLALFYESSINAMAEMVVNRNYNTIMVLEQLFPYVMLVGIMSNKRISYCIRGSFVTLMQRLWVDRFPCEPNCGRVSLPDVVWVYEDLKELPLSDRASFPAFDVGPNQTLHNSSHLFYNTAHQYKYRLLRIFVEKYLSEYDASFIVANKSENTCITKVMSLVSDLVSFGFYSSKSKLEVLLKKLLPILDGRTDVYPSEGEERAGVMDITRYQRSNANNLVMQAKVSMLSVITQALNLRQQFRLRKLMCNFKLWCTESLNASADFEHTVAGLRSLLDSADEKDNALNLKELITEVPVDAIFFDLLMYDDVVLFESTWRTFERENTMRASLMTTAARCFFLDDATLPVFGTLAQLDDNLSDLTIHFQSASLWSVDGTKITDQIAMVDSLSTLPANMLAQQHVQNNSYFTVDTNATYSEIWATLAKLKEFLNTSPKSAHQQLLENYNVDTILMSTLNWTLEEATASKLGLQPTVSREGSTVKNSLYSIVEACLSILFDMTVRNPVNRAKFRQYVVRLSEQTKLFPTKIFGLLSEIYSGSKEQVSTTPESLFAAFAELLVDNTNDDDIVALTFFRNQLLPVPAKPDPIPRNQALVAQYLLPTIKKPNSLYAFKNLRTDADLRDHIKAVEVLARCCRLNGTVGSMMSNTALTWVTAASRLNALFKRAVFPFAEKTIPKIPANLGIHTKPDNAIMTGTMDQCIWFIHAYVRYLTWMYFDGTAAIDVNVLNDDAIVLLVCNLSHFVFSSLSWTAPEPDPDFPGIEFTENPLGIPLDCNLLDVLFDFFNDYVMSLHSAGGKSKTKVTEALRLACTQAKNVSNRINALITKIFAHLDMSVTSLLLTEQTEESDNKASSRASRGSMHSDADNPVEALNENYHEYLYFVAKHPDVKQRLADESRNLINKLLQSAEVTDPDNRDYVRKIKKVSMLADLKFSDITGGVGDLAGNLAGGFSGGLSGLQSGLANAAGGVADGLANVAGGVADRLSTVAGSVAGAASGNFEMPGLGMRFGNDDSVNTRVEEKRTNKVTWGDVVKRMIRYIERKVASMSPHVCTVRILNLLCVYLKEAREKDARASAAGVLNENLVELVDAQKELNRYGVLKVCLLLISTYDSGDVYEAALQLAELMLENGNAVVQDTFVAWCKGSDSGGNFFRHLSGTIFNTVHWVETTRYDPSSSIKPAMDASSIRACCRVINLMSQLCEGHHHEIQSILNDQTAINQCSFNLVRPVVLLLHTLCPRSDVYRKINPLHITLMKVVMECLIELTQGPCVACQNMIGSHATFNSLKVILSVPPTVRFQHIADMIEIQVDAINLCAACLEGEASRAVAEAMVSKLDVHSLYLVYENMNELYELAQHSSVVDSGTKQEKKVLNTAVLHEYVKATQKEEKLVHKRVRHTVRKSVVTVENLRDLEDDDYGDEDEEDAEQVEITAEELRLAMRNLLAVHKYLSLNIKSFNELVFNEEDMPEFHADFVKELGRVEVLWHGKVYEVSFPLPEEAGFLSDTTKENFMEEMCTLDTPDTRVKGLMDRREELLDDMTVLRDISNIPYFKFILDHYTELRSFLYAIVILINFDLTLSLSHGSTLIKGYGDVDTNGRILIILGVILFLGYGSMAVYWGFQVSLLNYRRLSRILKTAVDKEEAEIALEREAVLDQELKVLEEEMEEERSQGFVHKLFSSAFGGVVKVIANLYASAKFIYLHIGKGWDLKVFRPTLFLAGAYIVACFMHYNIFKDLSSRVLSSYMKSYFLAGILIIGPLGLYTVRQMIETPYTYLDLLICMVYDLVFDIRFLTYACFTAAVVFGLAGYHFLYTIVLLEFLNMSVYARNTIKSVTQPWKQLLNIGFIFLIVSQIYGIFAFTRFGGTNAIIGGQVDDDNVDSCDSVFNCLALVYYEGIRSLDSAAFLPDAAVNNVNSFTGRFFFDMTFYIIAGCLLWNMVTGIIVDSFGELRDESTVKDELLNQESFIAGLKEDDLEATTLYLTDLKDTYQNPWHYLFYAIYLTRKNASDCDGIESYCLKCIHEEKTDWFPTKTCVVLERLGASKSNDDDVDPTAMVMKRLDAMEGALRKLDDMNALDKRMDRIEELLTALAEARAAGPTNPSPK